MTPKRHTAPSLKPPPHKQITTLQNKILQMKLNGVHYSLIQEKQQQLDELLSIK